MSLSCLIVRDQGADEMQNGGTAYFGVLWGLVFGDWFARMIKSKTLMVDKFRQGLGY